MSDKPKRRTRTPQAGELLPPERRGISTPTKTIPAVLKEQHVIHGVFGTVFEELGGAERLADWANDNYDKFIQMFAKMAPAPKGESSTQAIQINVNNQLGPSNLDG
jgi:hypothetical protein